MFDFHIDVSFTIELEVPRLTLLVTLVKWFVGPTWSPEIESGHCTST